MLSERCVSTLPTGVCPRCSQLAVGRPTQRALGLHLHPAPEQAHKQRKSAQGVRAHMDVWAIDILEYAAVQACHSIMGAASRHPDTAPAHTL